MPQKKTHLDPRAVTILDFWFGDLNQEVGYFDDRMPLWFGGAETLDREIETRFGKDLSEAVAGKLDHWRETPKGAIALIVLLDQFSLSIFREKPASYQNSELALPIARHVIAQGWEWVLTPAERLFLYLPFEHAENIPDQDYCVARFEALTAPAPARFREVAEGYLDYARRHQRVVRKYGRFPDRNEVFGRPSTPEEQRFLASDEAPF